MPSSNTTQHCTTGNTASPHSAPQAAGLWSYVPACHRDQDEGTLHTLIQVFQEQLHSWQKHIDRILLLHDPQHTPAWAVDLLLRTWGVDPPDVLQTPQKRRLLRWVLRLHRRAGTATGIQQAVRAITGLPTRCLPMQHGWTLDTQQALDHNAQLADAWDTNRAPYAFDIQVCGLLTQQQHQAVRHMVESLQPVHCPLRHVLQGPTALQQAATRLLGRCALYLLRQQHADGTWPQQTPQHTGVIAQALQAAAQTLSWDSLQQAWLRARKHLPPPHKAPAWREEPLPATQRLDRTRGLLCTAQHSLHMAPLDQQALALHGWTHAGWHDHAHALLAGLTRLPHAHGAAVDPATQCPAALHSIALLTHALARVNTVPTASAYTRLPPAQDDALWSEMQHDAAAVRQSHTPHRNTPYVQTRHRNPTAHQHALQLQPTTQHPLKAVAVIPAVKTNPRAPTQRPSSAYRVLTNKPPQLLHKYTHTVTTVSLSPDGSHLASGSYDKTVSIWNLESVKCLRRIKGHAYPVNSVSWSANGTRVASGSVDKTVRIWDVKTGKQVVMQGHTFSVTCVSLSGEGTHVASGSTDNTVRIWDVETGKQLQCHASSVKSVSLSADGARVASGNHDNTIQVWDIKTGTQLQLLQGHTACVNSVSLCANGTRIASGSDDKTVRIWDVDSGTQLQMLQGHTASVKSVSLSADGTRVASGSYDKTVRVWDVETGTQLHNLTGHTDTVRSVSLSLDGTRVASGSTDKTIRIWDIRLLVPWKQPILP